MRCSPVAARPSLAGRAHDDAEHPRPGAEHPSASTSRALLAYFSRAGENYHHGDTRVLEVGNTEVLAGRISAQRHRRLNHVQAEDHTTVPRLLTERRDDLVAEGTRTLNRLASSCAISIPAAPTEACWGSCRYPR